MDVAEFLIETFRLMERSGKKPSVRLAMRFARDLGFSVTNDRGYSILSKFSEHRRSSAEQPGAQNEHKRSSTEQDGATAEHLRARDKGIPSSKELTSVSQTRLPLEKFAKERQVTDALWERIGSIPGKTKTGWRKENIGFIRDMLAAGSDTDEILTAHQRASERTGRVVHWLKIVQDQIGRDAQAPPAQKRASFFGVAEIR